MPRTPNNIHPNSSSHIFDDIEVSETLSNLYAQVSRNNCLTPVDRQLIRYVLTQNNLKEEDSRVINRILYSVRRGWIKLGENLNSTSVSHGANPTLQIVDSIA